MTYNTKDKKIKTLKEIKKIIGEPPREKKVIMCHGTFDIVHPGHIRQLHYAKEKASILITSVTSDKYVTKGSGKPFVPQELRAKNLAVLEIVDYVIIDDDETPIKAIKKIKPDIFVKGFEYKKDDIHPKTQKEMKAVESYGGKLIFSPGDVIYSSTHILSTHKPKISYDKIISYMDTEEITFDDVIDTLSKFKNVKVEVLGDTIVDRYTYCNVLGPTTKTPTFSVKFDSSETFVGGAGIVAKHMKSLGADVKFTTVLGDDNLKNYVIKDLRSNNVKVDPIIDTDRPTTLKERFWADGYKMLQVDKVDNRIVSKNIVDQIVKRLNERKNDVVILSDFRHGIFNKVTIEDYRSALGDKTIIAADSQVSNRWGNILDFKNVDLIFPNEKEARFALADQDTGIRPLAWNLYKKSKSKYLILKMGEKGILVYRKPGEKPRDFFIIDSFAENVIDGVGAGDAMLAVTSLGYKCSNNILIGSILGNIAAAITCEKEGNIPVKIGEIKDRIKKIIKNGELG